MNFSLKSIVCFSLKSSFGFWKRIHVCAISNLQIFGLTSKILNSSLAQHLAFWGKCSWVVGAFWTLKITDCLWMCCRFQIACDYCIWLVCTMPYWKSKLLLLLSFRLRDRRLPLEITCLAMLRRYYVTYLLMNIINRYTDNHLEKINKKLEGFFI